MKGSSQLVPSPADPGILGDAEGGQESGARTSDPLPASPVTSSLGPSDKLEVALLGLNLFLWSPVSMRTFQGLRPSALKCEEVS